MSRCNIGYSLMFIYIHILSVYKLFLYFNLYLSVMLDSLLYSFTSTSFLTTSCSFTLICVQVHRWIVSHVHFHPYSYYKLFLYFNMCLSVMLDSLQCSLTLIVSKCNIGESLVFIYIYILSCYKLFLYFNLYLSVMLDSLLCSFTSIPFLTTSCSFTLIFI